MLRPRALTHQALNRVWVNSCSSRSLSDTPLARLPSSPSSSRPACSPSSSPALRSSGRGSSSSDLKASSSSGLSTSIASVLWILCFLQLFLLPLKPPFLLTYIFTMKIPPSSVARIFSPVTLSSMYVPSSSNGTRLPARITFFTLIRAFFTAQTWAAMLRIPPS